MFLCKLFEKFINVGRCGDTVPRLFLGGPEVSSFLIPQIPVARCFLLQLLFPVRCRSWLNT